MQRNTGSTLVAIEHATWVNIIAWEKKGRNLFACLLCNFNYHLQRAWTVGAHADTGIPALSVHSAVTVESIGLFDTICS